MKTRLAPLVLLWSFLTLSCSSDNGDSPTACADPLLEGTTICLSISPSASLDPFRAQIERISRETMSGIRREMPIDDLYIQVRDAAENAIPEIGMGGYNPDAERIIISLDPSFPDFGAALDAEFGFQLAHEVHHARRRRAAGYGSTLLQATVSEGLADHFAMEVTGKPAPLWSVALQGEDLESVLQQAASEWDNPSYEHAAWFYGTTQEIPRWAGYSMGYELVRRYKAANPGAFASGLYGTPASEFAP